MPPLRAYTICHIPTHTRAGGYDPIRIAHNSFARPEPFEVEERVRVAREEAAADFAREQLAWGAGPRATQFLILGAKARALVYGRPHVAIEDIKALAKPVLRHRLVVNFAAESDGITTDLIIDQLLQITPTHENDLLRDDRFQKIFA